MANNFSAKYFTLASCKTLAIVETLLWQLRAGIRGVRAAQGTAGVPPHACDAVLKS